MSKDNNKKYTYAYGKRIVNYSDHLQEQLAQTICYSEHVQKQLDSVIGFGFNNLSHNTKIKFIIPINDGIWSKIKNRIFKDEHPDKNYRL